MLKKNAGWPKTRKLFNDIHLWLGLISGIIIFVVCLSGTIYVYNTEAKEMASPALYRVKVENGAQKLSPETLISIVSKNVDGKVISIKIPADQAKSYTFMVRKNESAAGIASGDEKGTKKAAKEKAADMKPGSEHPQQSGKRIEKRSAKAQNSIKQEPGRGAAVAGRGTAYFVNPYTGEILGNSQSDKSFTSGLMASMFSLHRWLLLDKIEAPLFGELPNRKLGSYITGTATILFTFGVITGIVIWFPKKIRSWKRGLEVKWSGNWKRVNHDLHNSLGFYSCIILLIMGLTGPQWSFPWYRDGLKKTLGTYEAEDAIKPASLTSVIKPGNEVILLTGYLNIADKQFAYAGDYTVSLPSDSTDVINISKNKLGFFAPAASDKLILDQYSGAVLQTVIFKDKPFNERISGSIKALHVGDVYGRFSKLLYFISCLIATSLPVTGTLIWINKLKKKPIKKTNKAVAMSLT